MLGNAKEFLDSEKKDLQCFKVTEPDYLMIADKPLNLGGTPTKISVKDVEEKFKFKYSENIVIPRILISECKFNHEKDKAHLWEAVNNRLQNPLNDKLVLCFINAEVGYGVFANELIKAGTIIGIYSGMVNKKIEGVRNDYGISIHNSPFKINADQQGGITRFIQHLPFSFASIKIAIENSDKNSFLNILSGNSIYFSKTDLDRLNDPLLLNLSKIANIATLNALTIGEQEEMHENDHLNNIRNLAIANIRSFTLEYDGKVIVFFQTCLDIQKGEQLGITYGQMYWTKKGKIPQYFDKNGNIIPRDICINSLVDIVKLFKKSNDSWFPDINEVLRQAAFNGRTFLVKLLVLEYGALIDHQSEDPKKNKLTALHLATKERETEMVRLLIDLGANPETKDIDGKTALHYAALLDHDDVALILFEHGVSVEVQDIFGKKPFDYNPAMAKRIFNTEYEARKSSLFTL